MAALPASAVSLSKTGHHINERAAAANSKQQAASTKIFFFLFFHTTQTQPFYPTPKDQYGFD